MRSSWRTALALVAALVVVAFVAGVFLLIHFSRNQVGTATVYAAYLAAVSLAISLIMVLGTWWLKGHESAAARFSTREQICAAADWLADVVADKWRLEAAARRIVTPAPATVRWRWATAEVTAPRLEVAISPPPGTGPPPLPDLGRPGELLGAGVVTRLHDEVYARLPHGRLVLIGGPGSGKTGAMILLLLAALNRRREAGDQRDRVPVPVWLTLGGWDPAARSLQDWVLGMMERDYPALRAQAYGADAPGGLLRDGRVALFLDGLDEMPEDARPLALERVEEETRGLRVVLTSRAEEYRDAFQAGRLGNSAVVELRPVRPDAAATYLLRGQAGPGREEWEKVAAYIRDNPNSVAARALDNPLALSLARDTYTGQDPTELADLRRFPTGETIIEHLIDRFLITAYPDEQQRKHAVRWLAWIAYHMETSQDLQWWDIPSWIPRWKLRLARGVVTGLVIGLAIIIGGSAFGQTPLDTVLPIGLTFGFVAGLAVSLARIGPKVAASARAHVPTWQQWLLSRRALGRKLWLTLGLSIALLIGIATRTVSGLAGGLVTGFIYGGLVTGFVIAYMSLSRILGSGLSGAPKTLVPRWPRGHERVRIIVAGLVFFPALVPMFLSLWATPIADSPSSTAAGTYRADRRTAMIYGLVYAIAFGLLAGLLGWFRNGHADGLAAGLLAAIGWGFIAGLAIWLTAWLVAGQVPLIKSTELILNPRHRGRVHFLRLLEDAFARQVLRQAGTLYQFRHAALQARLAAMYRKGRPPSASPPALIGGQALHLEPIPSDLQTAMADPNMDTRLGVVSELRSRLTGDDLPIAAAAYEALAELAWTDIPNVADPAAAALDRAALHPGETELHFGERSQGSTPPSRVVCLLGPPIARACTPRVSDDWIRFNETAEGFEISVDTNNAGIMRGTLTLRGLAGEAVIAVTVEIVPQDTQQSDMPRNESNDRVSAHFAMAIASTALSFIPFVFLAPLGIAALVYSFRTRTSLRIGDLAVARKSSARVVRLVWITVIIWTLVLIIYIAIAIGPFI